MMNKKLLNVRATLLYCLVLGMDAVKSSRTSYFGVKN